MEIWKNQGIPLHIVLRGVEKSFDSYEAKPRKRSVKSLLYCQEEVEAQYAEWLESRVGSNQQEMSEAEIAEEKSTQFSFTAVKEHLTNCRHTLSELAQKKLSGSEDLTEAVSRAALLLKDLENDLVTSATLDSRRLEDSLTGLERMLNDAIMTSAPTSELNNLSAEVKAQLSPYRKQMDKGVYEQTFNNLLLKRLREHFQVPRLSLFYL
jgi:hypothetical protein